jgi:hypothetical protein
MLAGPAETSQGIQGFTAQDTTASGLPFFLDSRFVSLLKLFTCSACSLAIGVGLLRGDLVSFIFAIRRVSAQSFPPGSFPRIIQW